jgi:hypothetical protein
MAEIRIIRNIYIVRLSHLSYFIGDQPEIGLLRFINIPEEPILCIDGLF